MVESIIKENNKPKYLESELVESGGLIILTSPKKNDSSNDLFNGTVIFLEGTQNSHYNLGETRSDWLKDSFTLFSGELILKNK